jgi:cytosine/adenosine deaminase-related metal-dependent hydrolase
MRAAGEDSLKWALEGATYFDHETHRFVIGDIEIDGEQVAAIKPSGASTLGHGIDARRYVCTPGLVGVPIDGQTRAIEPDRLIQRGITTAALFFPCASECIRAIRRTRARLYAHLLLNPFSRARAAQSEVDPRVYAPELRVFERVAAQMARHGGRLLPAIDCACVSSAHELLFAQDFADALGLKLNLVLSDNAQAARAFRERFYCTEMQLLAFLRLLQPQAVVWGLSQLARPDLRILRESGATAVGLPQTKPEARVDAATIAAATALGDPTCGRIAPGMRADLCLFSTADRSLQGSGSESFIRLFEASTPDAVIIAGKFVGGDFGEWAAPSDNNAPPSLVKKRQADQRERTRTAVT